MSDTPRTDDATWHQRIPGNPVGADVTAASFSAGLERELADANQRVKELEEALSFVVPVCDRLHHHKRHQHNAKDECPVEAIIRKAKGTKP